MHCSVWRFVGNPDELERRYLAMLAEIPESNHVLHAAARTPDGLLSFDACPSEEAYHTFFDPGGPAGPTEIHLRLGKPRQARRPCRCADGSCY